MCSEDIAKHESLILQFRESLLEYSDELESFQESDWYLLKFLQEYNLNLKRSIDVLLSATRWKRELKLHLSSGQELEMLRRFPYDNEGVDRNGNPVLFVPFGQWKIRDAVENGETEAFLRHGIRMTERNQDRLRRVVEASNGSNNSVIIIFDLKDYQMKEIMHRRTISTLSEWTRRSEELYPQQLKSFIIINANRVMPLLFALLKPFMSRTTVNRVQIFNSNRSEWESFLLRHIPPSQLPMQYGGSKRNTY